MSGPDARVVVLAGGLSHERDVSLRSGRRVAEALRGNGLDVTVADVDGGLLAALAADPPGVVVPLLHGASGEDGALRDVLGMLGLPYVGSLPQACRVAFDKPTAKTVAATAGLATPASVTLPQTTFRELGAAAVMAALVDTLGLPLMVKPASQGSSVGITKVKAAQDLESAYEYASGVDPIVFAERFVTGDEYTVGVLQGRGLPSIRIQPATEFYDYQAKYFRNDTQYHCPSGLSAAAEAELQAAALAAFQVTDCSGWGRVDFMRDRDTQKFYFIEINTTPGMTDHSLVPMAARQAGIGFDELVWRVLETSFARARK